MHTCDGAPLHQAKNSAKQHRSHLFFTCRFLPLARGPGSRHTPSACSTAAPRLASCVFVLFWRQTNNKPAFLPIFWLHFVYKKMKGTRGQEKMQRRSMNAAADTATTFGLHRVFSLHTSSEASRGRWGNSPFPSHTLTASSASTTQIHSTWKICVKFSRI